MKVKELKRTVNVCWSPADYYPVTLAAGSAAQQVDSSFSSSSYLELYSLNLEDPGLDLELKSSLQTQHKFQKIVWSGAGVLVGGCDGGLLQFYSAEKLLSSASDALLGSSTKHNGHVSALDINPYQKNLLASGASDSEIFIWDLNNTGQPMAPGTRNQPYDHVQGLAWNQQVQHILGSAFATKCVVWDLRKNEPIMKLSDSQSRTRWRALAWHPSVATQLCIASEDDQVPVVQLWDLRLAASPLVTLEGHHKGVMSVSWCKQDSDLLLSAGKDGRVLCWNPNNTKPGGELLTEISQQQQWVFDVSWCLRDPGLLACSSFDQQVSVHSLLGGSRPEMNSHNQSNIMESFGGVDSFSQLPHVSRAPPAPAPAPRLPAAPRWLRRPAAAHFAFGGKLVTFEKCPQEAGQQKVVYISQVVSEPEIVERAAQLEAVLSCSLSNQPGATEQLAEYCRQKGDSALDQNERYKWFFLRANFLPTFRSEVLDLLGFKQDEMFRPAPAGDGSQPAATDAALSRDEPTGTDADLSADNSTDLSDDHRLIERKLANVDLDVEPTITNVVIPDGEDSTSLICRALVCGHLEEAVELCLDAKRTSDAMVIASLGSPELLHKVQKYHLQQTAGDPVSLVCGSLLESRWAALVRAAAAGGWRRVLAALVTHCDGDALAHYCEMLGDKLSEESDPSLSEAATICYLCAMSPEALVQRLGRDGPAGATSLAALTDLTELALLARRAALARGRQVQAGGRLERVVSSYAGRLAAQGCLRGALATLEGLQHAELRERLLHALSLPHPQPSRRASQLAQQPAAQAGGMRSRTASGHVQQQRPHPLGHNDVSNAYGAVSGVPEQAPWQQPAAPQHSFTPRAGYAPPAPAAAPAPAPMPLQPSLQPQQQQQQLLQQQPPRPGSVGPQAGGISTRSKYKVDPSVQSAPLYNQYSFNNPVTSQPYGGFNSPPPEQYAAASVPAYTPLNPSVQNAFDPVPNNPGMGSYNGGYYQGQAPVEQAVAALPVQKPQSGWNDPPMMSSKPKADMSALHAGTRQWTHIIEHRRLPDEAKPQEVQPQAPITHPLFGVEPPQHVPLTPAPAQHYPAQLPPQHQYQQDLGQQYMTQQYQGHYPGAMAPAYPQQQEASPAPVEPAPVQKPPIPEEHVLLQQVFDSLREECCNRAVNPQMKRKLEDVQRRLETLYDMLREHRLSESALAALHACAAQAQAGRAAEALAASAALAAGADFAAAASFLPGLKALLQLAMQLQVCA